MTEPRGRERVKEGEATYTDFGEAITRLQESMEGLSTDMNSLGEATAKLEASTRTLSEKQGEISEQMARTAEEIRGASAGPGAQVGRSRAAPPADD